MGRRFPPPLLLVPLQGGLLAQDPFPAWHHGGRRRAALNGLLVIQGLLWQGGSREVLDWLCRF